MKARLKAPAARSSANRAALRRALPLAPLALLATACGGGGGGGGPAGFVYEREPNDFPDEADGIGFVDAAGYYAIRGHVSGYDPLDGFAFSAVPVDVEVVLHTDNPWADLVLYVYDPVSNTFPFLFDQLSEPLVGSFRVNVPADFHLVVGALAGSSAYTLEVAGFPWGSYASGDGAAPLAAAAGGRFAGPAATADGARRARAVERAEAYRAADAESEDAGGGERRVPGRGVLAVVDDRGDVTILDAVLFVPAKKAASGGKKPPGPASTTAP